MDRETRRTVESFRRDEAGPIENTLIDELVGGELDRQAFLRRAAAFGLGAGTIGALLRYVGEAEVAHAAPAVLQAGGTLRVAITRPGMHIEPSKLDSVGGVGLVSIVGEYLTYSNPQGQLRPWLATSWKPSDSATVWTFQIRRGVTFHTGQPLTAEDVVATWKTLAAKDSAAQAALQGVLTPAGVEAVGSHTVRFELEAPNGFFPYLVGQSTYWGAILPRDYQVGTWVASKMPGTGPYRLQSYQDGRSATFVRNNAYWGGEPPLDAVRVTMYESTTPQVVALRAGQVDLVQQLSARAAAPLAGSSRYKLLAVKTANHRQLHMRGDMDKFRDPRTRRALALTLDRPELVATLSGGRGSVGNDSPFAPFFPSTSGGVEQRVRNIRQAKALLEASGRKGLAFTLTTWQNLEIPDYAEQIRRSARDAGIRVTLRVLPGSEYFGAPPGQDYATTTPWLNREATLTDYGHRPIPNVYLTGSFSTGGEWNAARYSNKRLDSAVRAFVGATSLKTQRARAKEIQTILLADTPVVVAYFFDWIAAGRANVKGYVPEGLGAIGLRGVSLV